jgi:septal ring factor EnvC (AmiA/AmiB activator)
MKKRDPAGFTTRAVSIDGIIKAIIKYESEEYDQAVKAEERAFVGERVVKTEAVLQTELARFKLELRNIEDQITAIETDITALTAQYDAYLREVEQKEIEKNQLKMKVDY